MENRVCIFVDGENLRHTIIELFAPRFFNPSDYMPTNARWDAWFDTIATQSVSAATSKRIRTYWFVSENIYCYPPLVTPQMDRAQRLGWLKRNSEAIQSSKFVKLEDKKKLRSSLENERLIGLKKVTDDLQGLKGWAENMFGSNHRRQNFIAENNRAVEFCRSGEITYQLFRKGFGQEKTVDVNLALSMVLRSAIYDTAVIVSGDQDYVPAVQQVKNLGKHVVNVSFEAEGGRLLPGGAKRLNEVTDWSLQIPFADFQTALDLTEEIPQEDQKQTNT